MRPASQRQAVGGHIAGFGKLDLLQRCRDKKRCPWYETTLAAVAGNGHPEVVKYLIENDCPWSEVTRCEAAENGHARGRSEVLGK